MTQYLQIFNFKLINDNANFGGLKFMWFCFYSHDLQISGCKILLYMMNFLSLFLFLITFFQVSEMFMGFDGETEFFYFCKGIRLAGEGGWRAGSGCEKFWILFITMFKLFLIFVPKMCTNTFIYLLIKK